MLGNTDLNGPGGFLLLDDEFKIAGTWAAIQQAAKEVADLKLLEEVDKFADFGLGFGNPDFVAYTNAYGAKGWQVGKTSELATMLEAAFSAGGVHLVVVPIDYSENMRVLVDELHSVKAV